LRCGCPLRHEAEAGTPGQGMSIVVGSDHPGVSLRATARRAVGGPEPEAVRRIRLSPVDARTAGRCGRIGAPAERDLPGGIGAAPVSIVRCPSCALHFGASSPRKRVATRVRRQLETRKNGDANT